MDVLLAAESAVPAALAAASAGLAAAVERAAEALTAGGRLIYVGAGTPGRLAALDAAECPPTYGLPPDRVVAIVAGGDLAESTAVEGAEDDAAAGADDLAALGVGPKDVVVGISASGRTPYVLAALESARAAGAKTVAIVNNPGSPAVLVAEVAVELLTGPEVLAGSTRLKAGSAQKVALNVISTGAMITAGRTYGAWMVDVIASNEKLRRRARRILREATGVDDDTALAALEDAGWHTKTALVALLAGVPADVARERLERHGGWVRRAVESGLVIVVSVASGTSADGLDVGVVDLHLDDDGVVEVQVVDTWTADWPPGLRDRLLALLPPAEVTARELALVDTAVGQAVADAATEALRVAESRGTQRPELVVSPGQTVHHEVVGDQCLGTLQLGQPAWVAEATGLPVVSDLRATDVAAGGHGAPLAGVLDGLWLAGEGGPRVALNLGGIANVTVVGERGAEAAWDTGPANCLLDVASVRATGGRQAHDPDGALARAGQVHPELLAALLEHPYFAIEPPKSTGRETFSAAYLDAGAGQVR